MGKKNSNLNLLIKVNKIKKDKNLNYFKKNLFLKVIKSKDINLDYVKWLNDSEVTKFTEQRHMKHTKKKVIKYVNEKYNSKYDLMYGIFFKEDKKSYHIGNIKITIINLHDKRADFSYLIGNKEFWGKGITTLAVKKMKIISKKIGLKKITANCYVNNIGSLKVLKKNGFKIEGKHSKNANFFNKRIDTYSLGLLL